MIEISFGKLVLLALIALIVLGPEKLPGAARTAGALLRRVRSGWDSVRSEVERELEIEEIKRAAREAAAQTEAAQAALDKTLQQVRDIREPWAASEHTEAGPGDGTHEGRGVSADKDATPAAIAAPASEDTLTGDLFGGAGSVPAPAGKESQHGGA